MLFALVVNLCYFRSEQYDEHIRELILNLDQWFRGETVYNVSVSTKPTQLCN